MSNPVEKTTSLDNEKAVIDQASDTGAGVSSINLANYYEDNAGSEYILCSLVNYSNA